MGLFFLNDDGLYLALSFQLCTKCRVTACFAVFVEVNKQGQTFKESGNITKEYYQKSLLIQDNENCSNVVLIESNIVRMILNLLYSLFAFQIALQILKN